jgi:glutamine synthetase
VPHSDPANRRIENRIIGVDANPYLALAATLAAGYLGMTEALTPTAESKGSAYNLDFELPRNLFESLDALKASEPIRRVLGDRFVRLYCSVKQLEYAEFMKVISPWEREHLLLHV